MNRRQQLALIATAAVLLALVLFPPFTKQYLQGMTENAGHAFMFNPPTYTVSGISLAARVNVTLLGLEYLFVGTIGLLLFFALKSR